VTRDGILLSLPGITAEPARRRTPVSMDLSPAQHVCEAARHLYEAECALHIAHQTGIDCWITAASDRLHDAVVALVEAERVLDSARSQELFIVPESVAEGDGECVESGLPAHRRSALPVPVGSSDRSLDVGTFTLPARWGMAMRFHRAPVSGVQ